MQVYGFPDSIQLPDLDISAPNWNADDYERRTAETSALLKEWLLRRGWTGPNTGELFSIPHADGYAQYMVAEGPVGSRQFALIHLPYWDAWDSPFAQRVTKRDVLGEIQRGKRLTSIFAARTAQAPGAVNQRVIRQRSREPARV